MSQSAIPSNLVSIEQALAALPVRKSRRWLVHFLHKTKFDPHGRPLYRCLGRDMLIYVDRLIEALPCPSNSFPHATKKRKVSTSEAATLESQWTRAAELTGDRSLAPCSSDSKVKSSAANIHHVNFREPNRREPS